MFINKHGVRVDKHLISVTPNKDIEGDLLAAILNSALTPLFREIHGRIASGEALARNEVWVNDAKKLPVLDPRNLTTNEKDRIRHAFTKLIERERDASEEELKMLYSELNRSVMAALGMEDRTEYLEKSVQELLQRRIKGGGVVREVMIDKDQEEGETHMLKIKGAEVISPPKSLDHFM